VEVGDILAGCIVIDILVAVAFEEVVEMFEGDGEVVTAAEADDFVKEWGYLNARLTACQAPRLQPAVTTVGGGSFVVPEGGLRSEHIFRIENGGGCFSAGVEVFGIEALFIDAVQAIDLDGAGLYFAAKGFDDLPVFVVIEAGGAGGEEQHRVAGVAKNEQLHIPFQMGAKPFMIFLVHGLMVDRYCRMISFHKA
jgi:hypothetical protein